MKGIIAIVCAAWGSTVTWVTFKTVCGWCGVRKNGNPFVQKNVSHGICQCCKARTLAELEAKEVEQQRRALWQVRDNAARAVVARLRMEGKL